MARDRIIEKLNAELGFALRQESQVQRPNAHEVLELFCNWALYIKISRKSDRLRLFFVAFDMTEGMSLENYFLSAFFSQFIRLVVLRRELAVFLNDQHLPSTPARDHRAWAAFIYLLSASSSKSPSNTPKKTFSPKRSKARPLRAYRNRRRHRC